MNEIPVGSKFYVETRLYPFYLIAPLINKQEGPEGPGSLT